MKRNVIPHLGGNGPPCPSSWEHLSLGWGEQWLKWEWMWRRGNVGGLRGKGLKASTGSITIGKGGVF